MQFKYKYNFLILLKLKNKLFTYILESYVKLITPNLPSGNEELTLSSACFSVKHVRTPLIIGVLFECGPITFNSLIKANMWNEMWLYMSMNTIGKNGINSLEDITRGFNITEKEVIGNLLEYKQIENDIKLILKNNNNLLNDS